MSKLLVHANEATAAQRRVYFHLVDATDGLTAETGEAGGQPQISSDGGAWTNTGIGTLSAIGNGRYYADLTQAAVQTAGTQIETRYKSANTAECPGDSVQVVAFDPNDTVRLGLTALPNAAAEAVGGLYTRGTGAGQINQSANGQIDVNAERLNNGAQSLLDLKGFADDGYDPSTNKVQGVVLADTVTTLTNDPTGVTTLLSRLGTPSNLGGGATIAQNLSDIESQTDDIGTAGAGLAAIPWNAAWDAEVQSEVADELTARGITAAFFAGITSLAQWLGLIAGKQVGNSTARTELRATGAGSGSFDETTDSLQAIRDQGDSAWGGGGGGGGDATAANQVTIINHLTGMKGTGWDSGDSLKAIQDGVAALSTGAGAFSIALTIYQSGGVTLVPECDVILTTTSSSPATNIYASGRTNANGVVTFQCDAGTYYIWRQKAGLNFSDNPKTLTVAANGSSTVT